MPIEAYAAPAKGVPLSLSFSTHMAAQAVSKMASIQQCTDAQLTGC